MLISVEDPSEDFVRLRDYVDCCNCMKLHAFREEQLRQGFSREMVQESKDTFKLCKRQARRVYEILRLKATKRSVKDEYKAYRVDVKRRLNIPFQVSFHLFPIVLVSSLHLSIEVGSGVVQPMFGVLSYLLMHLEKPCEKFSPKLAQSPSSTSSSVSSM